MKNLLKSGAVIILLLLSAVYAQAQDNAPKREFRLGLSSSSIELVPGETTSLDINIYRSKSYANKDIKFLATSVPDGLNVEFGSESTKDDVMVLTLKATDELSAGKYTVLLQGKTTRVTKGISFSVVVNEKSISKK